MSKKMVIEATFRIELEIPKDPNDIAEWWDGAKTPEEALANQKEWWEDAPEGLLEALEDASIISTKYSIESDD